MKRAIEHLSLLAILTSACILQRGAMPPTIQVPTTSSTGEPEDFEAPKEQGSIVFTSNREEGLWATYAMEPDGNAVHRLTFEFDQTLHEATWAPDGNRIAFVEFDGIYVLDAGAGAPTRILEDHTRSMKPVWSPDGTRIAFKSDRDRNGSGNEIYVVNADGTNLKRLTYTTIDEWALDWSPDGQKIVYSVYTPEAQLGAYIMDADGTHVTRLLATMEVADVAWSPDGSRIALAGARGNLSFNSIFVVNPDGTDLRQLTEENADDQHPAWSPDGRRIAFQAGGGDICVIDADWSGPLTRCVMNAVGLGPLDITNTPDSVEMDPDWGICKFGRQLAFSQAGDAFLIYADGSELTNLTAQLDMPVKAIAWSPDGQSIGIMEDSEQADHPRRLGILSVNDGRLTDLPAGSGLLGWSPTRQQILLENARWMGNDRIWSLEVLDLNIGDVKHSISLQPNVVPLFANWSPDGTRIAVSFMFADASSGTGPPAGDESRRQGGQHCYGVVDPVTGEIIRIGEWGASPSLTDCRYSGHDDAPVWSSDGDWLAYTAGETNLSDDPQLFLANPNTGKAAVITDLGWTTHTGEGMLLSHPHWSSQTRSIELVANFQRDQPEQIYSVDLASGTASPMATTQERWEHWMVPTWSPGEAEFAFLGYVQGGEGIMVYRANGTGRLVLASGAGSNAPQAPLWRPLWRQVGAEPDRTRPTASAPEIAPPPSSNGQGKAVEWTPCAGYAPSIVKAGIEAYISYVPSLSNRVRSDPKVGDNIIDLIGPGTRVDINGGPVCADNFVFWKIRTLWGLEGWTAGGDWSHHWLIPIDVLPPEYDEAQVRYILADIQLGGVDAYYRQWSDQAMAVEAIRRWDAGVRVTNIESFERKVVGAWMVVYQGTSTQISGWDVILSTD